MFVNVSEKHYLCSVLLLFRHWNGMAWILNSESLKIVLKR